MRAVQETDEMGDAKGTDKPDLGSWYIVDEAECLDTLDNLEDLFDESTDSDISNLIDNEDQVDEGNPLAFYHSEITAECNRAIADLKRKFVRSPEQTVAELSPRLEAVNISPQRGSKRRLFQDSGIEEDEAQNNSSTLQVDTEIASGSQPPSNGAACRQQNLELLNANHRKCIMLAKFKEKFGVAFGELTRPFKSNKTCCDHWVIAIYQAKEEVMEASKTVLQQYCDYLQVDITQFSGLYLATFKSAKCRETIVKLFSTVLNIAECMILCEPPKSKSVPTALYFYQRAYSNAAYSFGDTPDWIAKQVLVSHNVAAAAEAFNLSHMVQWAYDNNYMDESTVAYNYALLAEEDKNAAAFLKSNSQYKYVKDCVQMVRMYKRHEMKTMTMSQWIQKCCKECEGDGDWKDIAAVLRFQGVNTVAFLGALRQWLKGTPKRNCILIWGPPDSGKSYFAFSLLRFLQGKVVSFMNRGSQFWLQPLQDAKIGYIDDATWACWEYMDVNMRSALDGNSISVDAKHKAPIQLKLPPLLMTSNINVHEEQALKYLHSRIQGFAFPNKMPMTEEGTPVITLTDQKWKSFFIRLALQLDITFEEEGDEPERLGSAFRCTAGPSPECI